MCLPGILPLTPLNTAKIPMKNPRIPIISKYIQIPGRSQEDPRKIPERSQEDWPWDIQGKTQNASYLCITLFVICRALDSLNFKEPFRPPHNEGLDIVMTFINLAQISAREKDVGMVGGPRVSHCQPKACNMVLWRHARYTSLCLNMISLQKLKVNYGISITCTEGSNFQPNHNKYSFLTTVPWGYTKVYFA